MASKKNIAKYDAALERCRKNIEKTKGYIEYHKKMLRVFEAKESKLLAKLEDQKIAALRKSINLSGLDIDELCNAVANGDFGGAAPVRKPKNTNNDTDGDTDSAVFGTEKESKV